MVLFNHDCCLVKTTMKPQTAFSQESELLDEENKAAEAGL